MTDWMALPRTYPDEEKVLRWTPYILELRAEIDALKAPAAPTPVEDEVTEAEREYEPTYDMMQEGCEAYLNAVMQRADRAECDWDGLLAAYRAMRAARVPAPTPEPSAQPSEELRLLRALRDVVNDLGDTAQWRMRAEQRGYMVFCNAQDCADIADIQEGLAALDAAEGQGK